MIWLFKILRIYLEEQLPIKYYMIKRLILQKIQNMVDVNADFLQWFIHFLINDFRAQWLKLHQTKN